VALVQLSAGYSHACGVTTEGRVYCWGDNRVGEIGDGTTTQRLAPVAVANPM
jgi:alpha-tubulin suppressor-like RCC1 family protein